MECVGLIGAGIAGEEGGVVGQIRAGPRAKFDWAAVSTISSVSVPT